MKFARVAFVAAGIWGIVMVTPLFFLFDVIGRLTGVLVVAPDLLLGVLFAMSFAKTSALAGRQALGSEGLEARL